MDTLIATLIAFSAATLVSILVSNLTDIATVLKVLAVIIALLLISTKINIKWKAYEKSKGSILKYAGLFFLSLFVSLFTTATGGITSPFFVVVYVSTIALSLVFSFQIAFLFLAFTIVSILSQYYLSFIGGNFTIDPAILILQAASIFALIPFSFVLSKRYHLKGKIVDYLQNELSLSQNEEDLILENVDEGIITLDETLKIIKINKTAENLSAFKSEEIIGKNFFDVFKFKDESDTEVVKERFPLKELESKQSGFRESDLLLQKGDKTFMHINFKFTSLLGSEAKIETFLFVFNLLQNQGSVQDEAAANEGFNKFRKLISEVTGSKRLVHSFNNLELLYKLNTNNVPGILSNLDVGETVRKIINQNMDLASEYKVSLVNSTPITPPLPIETNKVIFEEAIAKVMELCIFIASKSNDKMTIVSTGTSPENIFVFIKTSTFSNFPWDKAADLLKPSFGVLSNVPELSEASGLEGYLSERLLKEKGFEGGITGGRFADGTHEPQLMLTVILPYKQL